jgi:hypothetical protein
MDLVTSTDLESLWAPGQPGVRVSLFLPTHRYGDEIQTDPLLLKNLLGGVEEVLARRGLRRPDVERLLGPARALQEESQAWQHMGDGLAIYLYDGAMTTFRVPITVPTCAVVGERYVVAPLLPLVATDEEFLLLAISQRTVRLFEGGRDRITELDLAEVPSGPAEMLEIPGRTRPMARRGTSAGPGAVFYGAGKEPAKEDVRQFLRQVSDRVGEYLDDRRLPLVLAGLPELLAAYREVNRYPHVLAEALEQNPDALSAQELHAAAWPIISRRHEAQTRSVLARLAELNGTGLASTDLQVVGNAAAEGRVATLLLTGAAIRCWEQASAAPVTVVELGTDPYAARCEAADRAVTDTLRAHGEVHVVSDGSLPGGADLAAIFRY